MNQKYSDFNLEVDISAEVNNTIYKKNRYSHG